MPDVTILTLAVGWLLAFGRRKARRQRLYVYTHHKFQNKRRVFFSLGILVILQAIPLSGVKGERNKETPPFSRCLRRVNLRLSDPISIHIRTLEITSREENKPPFPPRDVCFSRMVIIVQKLSALDTTLTLVASTLLRICCD
jgi:hypothetical protein